jgi:2-polyprenyl-3-methyl-5-hydroxy-6-metoxy-1,4-benzoquinol methylase
LSGKKNHSLRPNCPVTGGPAFYYGKKNGYLLWKSAESEIIFVDPLPSKKQLFEYYNSSYFDRDPGRYLGEEDSANIVWSRRIETIRGLSDVGSLDNWTILDVGAGTGAFLANVASQCREILAVEYSEDGRKLLVERLGLDEPVPAILEDLDLEQGSLDVITMWAVLEHLPFDANMFCKLRHLIKFGGIVAISVPNVQAWNRKWFAISWRYFTPPEHLIFYGLPALTQMLEQAGFRVLKKQSFFSQRAFKQGVASTKLPHFAKGPLRAAGWFLGGLAHLCSAGDTIEIYARAE